MCVCAYPVMFCFLCEKEKKMKIMRRVMRALSSEKRSMNEEWDGKVLYKEKYLIFEIAAFFERKRNI